ncbi:MAG TPA: acetylxylan esterase [Candidatus Hydrogenedentes bacterium]|nr:acetylxylan esterase [Candidatus Hydrogenedentota bacterium]HQH54365.1 acetylxylan esterase [Candidatus Hydrogenedentota bacterium]HQM51077.1 acetylxylan esterase [Candidatus Hydrogenedentota bacterium]
MMMFALLSMCCAAGDAGVLPVQWDMARLSQPPATYPAEGFAAEGVRALFYDALPFENKPTRVFAWMGIPDHPEGERVPGMVLVHGGGGTAYDEWVRIWNARGYAAIAMDLDGTVPQGEHGSRPTHEFSGPTSFGGVTPMDGAKEDFWAYHAVADIALAHSLLASQAGVDPGRIGLTGISWGGFLTHIAAAVDTRFQFAIPVYGCGFINEISWKPVFDAMPPEKAGEWIRLWDPSQYVAAITIPTLWVNAASDPHYYLGVYGRTYLRAGGTKTLSVQPGLGHSHQDGWAPKEIYAYADSKFKGGEPLIRIVAEAEEGDTAMAIFENGTPVKADLVWTRDISDWSACAWELVPATVQDNRVAVELPGDCAAYFINLTDSRGLITSTVCRSRK